MSNPQIDATAGGTSTPPPLHVNLFFRLAAGLVMLFVVTIFAMIANLFGDPNAPAAKFLDKYALHLIIAQTLGILICGALAMTVDRTTSQSTEAPMPHNFESNGFKPFDTAPSVTDEGKLQAPGNEAG